MSDQDIQRYEQMLADEPESRVFAPLADAYRKSNRLDEAIQTARAGLRHNPHYSGGFVVLGRALFEKGELGLAGEAIQKAVEEAPENYLAQKTLAKISMAQGENARALHALQAAILLSPEDMEIQSDIESLQDKVAHPGGIDFTSVESAEEPVAAPLPKIQDLEPLSDGIGGEEPVIKASASEEAAEVEDLQFPEFLSELSTLTERPTADIHDIDVIPETIASPDISDNDEQPSSSGPENDIFTETLADLYAQQGVSDEAAHIYEQLLDENPADANISEKIRAEIKPELPETISPMEDQTGSPGDPLNILAGWLENAERMKRR